MTGRAPLAPPLRDARRWRAATLLGDFYDLMAASTIEPMMAASEPKGFYNRWYLPHFDEPGQVQFITYRLYDSLPLEVIARLSALPPKQRPVFLLEQLDLGHGQCWLRIPEIARIVQDNLLHFDQQRYRLVAWCIMSNHVHSLIHCNNPAFSLPEIVQSWKSYTAKAANKVLQRTGQFWMSDYFDSAARTEEDVLRIAQYIENNPVKAGLVKTPEEWEFSSASYRATLSF